ELLREPHRHLVPRFLDAYPQRGRPVRGLPVVVLWAPDFLTWSLLDLNWRVENDGRRLVTVVERRSVDQRLIGRAGLPPRLDRAVELAQREGEAANCRKNATRVRVHC